jgi:hypothetical protein
MRREIADVYLAVIASAAKQSKPQYKERVDCFAALAMTVSGFGHNSSHSTQDSFSILPRTGLDTARCTERPLANPAELGHGVGN